MRRRALLYLSAIVLLSACTETLPMVPHPPDMTFDHFKKIELDVATIEVQNNYKPPMRDPYIEHLFPTPPYVAAANLVKRQLIATGSENTLRVLIDDASVVAEELPIARGLENLLTKEPAERLKAKVLLHFELVSPWAPDIVLGHAEVTARRTKTLLEGTSVAERERAYFSLTEDLMDDLNDGLRTAVKNTFGKKP
ncbi:MAG: hypothetical protein HY052_05265 [Proteobacteria bacterium]|nr:hypothetical protein [Pseudomonadota bacterium]